MVAVVLIWALPSVVWGAFGYAVMAGGGKSPYSYMPTWLAAASFFCIPASLFFAWYFGMRSLDVRSVRIGRALNIGCIFASTTLLAPFLPIVFW